MIPPRSAAALATTAFAEVVVAIAWAIGAAVDWVLVRVDEVVTAWANLTDDMAVA